MINSKYGFKNWVYKNKFEWGGSPHNLETEFEIHLQELLENHQEDLFEWIEEYVREESIRSNIKLLNKFYTGNWVEFYDDNDEVMTAVDTDDILHELKALEKIIEKL